MKDITYRAAVDENGGTHIEKERDMAGEPLMVECRQCGEEIMGNGSNLADRAAEHRRVKHGGAEGRFDPIAGPQQRCPECGHVVYGETEIKAKAALLDHWDAKHPRPPKNEIRWTITGKGMPVGTRKEVWGALQYLVEMAEDRGLRVEVAEMDQETGR